MYTLRINDKQKRVLMLALNHYKYKPEEPSEDITLAYSMLENLFNPPITSPLDDEHHHHYQPLAVGIRETQQIYKLYCVSCGDVTESIGL